MVARFDRGLALMDMLMLVEETPDLVWLIERSDRSQLVDAVFTSTCLLLLAGAGAEIAGVIARCEGAHTEGPKLPWT